jgi:hypothetical protein
MVIDELTKTVYWITINKEGLIIEKIAKLVIDFYIYLYGLRNIVINDRDISFSSEFWNHFTKL